MNTTTIFFYSALILLAVLAERLIVRSSLGRRHIIASIFSGAVLAGICASVFLVLLFGADMNPSRDSSGTVWGFLVNGVFFARVGLIFSAVALIPAAITAVIYRRFKFRA